MYFHVLILCVGICLLFEVYEKERSYTFVGDGGGGGSEALGVAGDGGEWDAVLAPVTTCLALTFIVL